MTRFFKNYTFILLFLVVVILSVWSQFIASTKSIQAATNPIVLENQKPGSSAWQPDQTGLAISDDVTKQIKGYASATSVNSGNTINFLITTNAPTFHIDTFRIGWYGGLGGRLMNQSGTLSGVIQPDCPTDSFGTISCTKWAKSYTLTTLGTPTSSSEKWTSGIYLAHLVTSTNYHDYIIFAVRDDSRTADLLYQQSVTTYQAYNNYPNDATTQGAGTGKSLYDFNSHGAVLPTSGDHRAVKVSFNRPYASGNGFSNRGHGDGEFMEWEIHTVRWLEENGYDVTYSTNLDTHQNPARLRTVKGFISAGHDEYYSKQMLDAVTAARDSGINLAFLGANDLYGQIRFEPDTNGTADRIQVFYRLQGLDPIADKSLETVPWRLLSVNPRPEEQVLGIQYDGPNTFSKTDGHDNPLSGGGDAVSYVVNNASNWTYTSTNLGDGQSVPRIVGYEVDRDMSQDSGGPTRPAFINNSYTLLSHSPYVTTDSSGNITGTFYANSVIYQALSGAWVFDAGSISWGWGLDNWRFQSFADADLQQMTTNILNKFISAPSPTPPSSLTIIPEADSFIDNTNPNSTAGGSSTSLIALGDGTNFTKRPFIRFNLASAVGKTVTSAKLRLTTTSDSNSGSTGTQAIKFLYDDAWGEPYLSWNNTVSPIAILNSPLLGSQTSPTQPNSTYDIPLDTAKVQSEINSTGAKLSMVIDNTSSDDFAFNSRESTTAQPQLILTFPGSTSSPSPSPTPSPIPTPTPTLTPTPSPSPAPTFTLFGNTTPGFISTNPFAVELGMKFRTSQSGNILGVRFYKGSGNIGPHTGSLWSNTGTLLAAATFTSESSLGWQEVRFTTPVSINANTTYIVSYNAPVGHFAQNAPGFSTAINSGPITGLQNGFDGPNGVYSGSGFPTSTYNASNYYVDVIFQ